MKIKLLSTLLLSCSFVLSFASTNLMKVNAITNDTVETQQTNEIVEKPDFYYSPSNEYNYQIRNDGFISPDSIEAWVRLPVASTGGTILGSGYSVLLSLNVDIYGKVGIKWNQTEVVHTFSDSTNIADNKWHHVAVVRTKQKFTYYLDGDVEGVFEQKSSRSKDDMAFNVGCGKMKVANRKPLEGFVKQVSIYEGAITEEQIEKDMLDKEITKEDVICEDVELFGNWVLGDYWTERYIENTVQGGGRATLFSFDKMVKEDTSYGEYDYSFAIFPDIQLMNNYNPDKLNRQIQWLADHKEEMNFEFAMFVGDLSDFGQKPELYERAASAMSRLDNIVPYCFVPGNHDYDDNAKTRSQVYFNTYFPVSKHSQMPGFGGLFEEDSMANSYYTFEIGEVKWLVLNLEYKPRMSVLRWANVIIEAHPDHRVIMETHSYLTNEGLFSSVESVGNEGNGGKDIFHNLMVKHPNVFLGVGGHEGMDEAFQRIDYGEKGNRIISMLTDLQGSNYNGDIWIDPFLIVHVNEEKKTMMFKYFSPEEDRIYNVQGQYEINFADPLNPAIGE